MFNKRTHIIRYDKINGLKVRVLTKCPFCGMEQYTEYGELGFYKWYYEGINIKDAMPTVSKDLRKILISGICNTCWDETFNEE